MFYRTKLNTFFWITLNLNLTLRARMAFPYLLVSGCKKVSQISVPSLRVPVPENKNAVH